MARRILVALFALGIVFNNFATAQDDAVYEVLNVTVDLDYDETPFIDIMDEIRDQYGINVLLDQSALDDALTDDEPMTIRVKGIPMSAALRLMLDFRNATYVVNNGVLKIISKDVAPDPQYFARRIINCKTLLEKIRQLEGERIGSVSNVIPLRAQNIQGGGFGPFPPSGGGVFQIADETEAGVVKGRKESNAEAASEKTADQFLVTYVTAESILIDTIKSTIAADDWDDTNGDGSLIVVGNCLIIQQSEETIDQVTDFVSDLESTIE